MADRQTIDLDFDLDPDLRLTNQSRSCTTGLRTLTLRSLNASIMYNNHLKTEISKLPAANLTSLQSLDLENCGLDELDNALPVLGLGCAAQST